MDAGSSNYWHDEVAGMITDYAELRTSTRPYWG